MAHRLGRGLSGVDRVERAWLRHALDRADTWGLVRTRFGFLLIDQRGMAVLEDALDGPGDIPGPVLIRPHALARCGRWGLARMLRRQLPRGAAYLNTGHANLTRRALGQIQRGLAGPRAVLVHDTIPLDHPDLSAPGMAAVFARRMAAVARYANVLIFTTVATQASARAHLDVLGARARRVVAPLGIDLPRAAGPLPSNLAGTSGFVLCVGTLEPRKNHILLIKLWEAAPDLPPLVLVGRMGWLDDPARARITGSPDWGRRILHLDDVTDQGLAALYDRAGVVVLPSLAEGYGLPPLEAAARGVPVIVSDLPVFRETLGDYAVYLPPQDMYAWEKALKQGVRRRAPHPVPTWSDHIAKVEAALSGAKAE